jgi:hypothetical protein
MSVHLIIEVEKQLRVWTTSQVWKQLWVRIRVPWCRVDSTCTVLSPDNILKMRVLVCCVKASTRGPNFPHFSLYELRKINCHRFSPNEEIEHLLGFLQNIYCVIMAVTFNID